MRTDTGAKHEPVGGVRLVERPVVMLVVATVGFGVNFWAWALLSPLGPRVKEALELSSFQQALVVAVPVAVGSLGRIPVGALTDRFGGRLMFPVVSAVTVVPVLFLGLGGQSSLAGLLVGGFFLGIGGTAFAVGVPLVSAWFPLQRRGLVLGVFGVGMGGTAVSALTTVRLVIATGAGMRAEEVPGLAEHAHQIWTPGQMHELGEALQWVAQHAAHGRPQRVLFLVPPNNKCAGPLYEIVFMLDTWLRRRDLRHEVEITFTTYENTFIQAFGPRLHAVVEKEFAERGIHGHTGAVVSKVAEQQVTYADGTDREFDLLIAFPPYVASVRYDGLPADDRGFLTCEASSRAVAGHPEIFAPGDAGDFPVKQAFLAFLQADTVAATIAAEILGTESPAGFEPTSMCVMEMFDKATFARVPLTVTGDPNAPVAVDQSNLDAYRVGTGKIWRLGKKTLGLYLPMRFGHGQPFHAGTPWRVMELGLRAGARWLAR